MKQAFLVLMLLAARSGSAAPAEGRVVDLQDLPVLGVRVVVSDSSGRIVCATTTAADGTWSCPEARSMPLLVTVTGEQWERALVRIDSTGRPAVIRLRPAALLQTVVVSGSRTEELQDESAQRVEAVPRRRILATGYERVSDVLAEIPGVVTRRGGNATVAGEQIQGIESRQVAILQDGLPVPGARGVKSGVVNLHRQGTSSLQQIEVAKGAGSALYGTDAIGGVINLISREPSHPFEVEANVSGGNMGLFGADGSVGGRFGNLSVLASGGTHRMDGYRLVASSPAHVGPDWNRQDGSLRLRWALDPKLFLSVGANGYHNHEEAVNLTEQGNARGVLNDSTQAYSLTFDYVPLPSLTAQARLYRARYDENSLTTLLQGNLPPSPANLNQLYQRIDSTLGYSRAGHVVQAGAEWAQDNYRGANRLLGDNAGQQITLTDGWVQDRWAISRRATITAGGRISGHSVYGVNAVPKAGLVVRATERLLLRASYGHGFRAPDLGQLYYRFANPTNFYQVIGNPTLRPETSRSIQAGAGWRGNRWRANLTLFHNRVRGLIDSTFIGTPRTPTEAAALLAQYGVPAYYNPILNRPLYLYQNLSRVLTRGAEIDGEVLLAQNWRVRGAYTFLDARDEATRLRLAQRHRHQGFIGTEYTLPRWGVSANLRGTFYSRWLLNAASGTSAYGYRIWDLYLSKQFRGLTAYASIDNLFDSVDRKLRETPPTFDRPDFGRSFRIGMRWNFPRE
ncbi:MAG: TonB-dependent receptor [Bryobacteraceae bacterium]|nr:TonB-dependent receptor [Bryobacteraceae bacterium]